MLALVTGATSGIGLDIAKILSQKGYDIIAVGRNVKMLESIKSEFKTKVYIENVDLSDTCSVLQLIEKYKNQSIDILVNSAGIGSIGYFTDIDLEKEISLINTNITALHILTKEVLKKMEKQNSGRILNIASSAAACSSGPLMATYYASKSYVYVLSRSIYYELKKNNSNVKISVALPGPVDTNFNKNLNISFSVKPLSSMYVAETCVNKMFKDKFKIVPGFKNKCGVFLSKVLPEFLIDKYIFNIQKKKLK